MTLALIKRAIDFTTSLLGLPFAPKSSSAKGFAIVYGNKLRYNNT
jgi:hypothetical protein